MKIDREKYPIVTQDDLKQFISELKPMELTDLKQAIKDKRFVTLEDDLDDLLTSLKIEVESAKDEISNLRYTIEEIREWKRKFQSPQ